MAWGGSQLSSVYATAHQLSIPHSCRGCFLRSVVHVGSRNLGPQAVFRRRCALRRAWCQVRHPCIRCRLSCQGHRVGVTGRFPLHLRDGTLAINCCRTSRSAQWGAKAIILAVFIRKDALFAGSLHSAKLALQLTMNFADSGAQSRSAK